jgi:hypothetical protein
MTSPGSNVVPCETKLMIFLTLKIMSRVFESCTTIPLTLVWMAKLFGSVMIYYYAGS